MTIYPTFAKGNQSYWGGLPIGSEYLPIINWANSQQSSLLIIANNQDHARLIEQGLLFYSKDITIILFPDYEVLPYDNFSPHEEIISRRLSTLSQILELKQGVVIATIESLMTRLCPRLHLQQHCFNLLVGNELDLLAFKRRLIELGYQSVNTVHSPGEFNLKGALIDFYPAGANNPIRLDLFDKEIDTIRIFDTQTQRTIEKTQSVNLLPAKEFSLDSYHIDLFLGNYQKHFGCQDTLICHAVSQSKLVNGLEFYLPLFFEKTEGLLDYMPNNTRLVFWEGLSNQVDQHLSYINERYQNATSDNTKTPLHPNNLYFSKDALFAGIKTLKSLVLSQRPKKGNLEIYNHGYQFIPAIKIENSHSQPAKKINLFLEQYKGRVLLVCQTKHRQTAILELLKEHCPIVVADWQAFFDNDMALAITLGQLEEEFINQDLAVITEKSIFGQSSVQQQRRRAKHKDFDQSIKNLIEINQGDVVVHERYGIGRYLGLKTIERDEHTQDFIEIAYAGDDKLLVPIEELPLVGQYAGIGNSHPPLHKLGTEQWTKAKKKATEQLHDIATELLEIYAKRASQTGFVYDQPDDGYQSFANEFVFEETPDQSSAITAVIDDMCQTQPMDRLICGDVGFGKTEIAMRAAYLAVASGKQVAILVPTTLLADQHYHSFVDRFINHSVNIGVLSRFQTNKQQIQTLEQLAQGKIDIIIGTHKLIQPRVTYHNLGLVIIDEEHRFGVKQKEQLKKLRSSCDILTMSATPIPRTLNMALSDIRDLSLIATPPLGRSSIKTFIQPWQDSLVQEACLREIHRGGQIFILHNDIDSIDVFTQKISKLTSNSKIRIAHGQMPNKELENIMSDFYHQRFHILVCTTIIETGIDIPTANTIIIDQAQNFGLAQLHQLRGRVGRSHHQAYAYLMTKDTQNISDDARKRLYAIASLEELGCGFMLANHDLEIRGSGDLLGKNQSGNIAAIGFNFYQDLLKRAVGSLQGLPIEHSQNIEIDTGISCVIPESYLGDTHDRLVFYKRINNVANTTELTEIKLEMIDRFHTLHPPIESLFAKTELQLFAKPLGVSKIIINDKGVSFFFSKSTQVSIDKILNLMQQPNSKFTLKNQDVLQFNQAMEKDISRIHHTKQVLEWLV